MAATLRGDASRCGRCGAPLATAAVTGRTWRLVRSGEHIGRRGEFLTLRCSCGARRQRLAQLAPTRG